MGRSEAQVKFKNISSLNQQAVGMNNLNDENLLFQNQLVSRLFTNIFRHLNIAQEHKSQIS